MSLWNGAPTVRIWIVGTRRVLGVEESGSDAFAPLPAPVRRIWAGLDADRAWASAIYGDFRVCPLTRSRPGWMQMVSVADASHLALGPRPLR